jgi:unsaturated rhamnogalacturonyl hydrolase
MKKLFYLLTCGLMLLVNAHAQENIYSKAYIKTIMQKVNNYQINHPLADNDDIWIRGTYFTGVMAAYQSTGNIIYLNQCNAWGRENEWKVPSIEMNSETSGANAMTCSQTWMESYMAEKKKYKIQPAIEHMESPGLKNPVNCPLTYYYEGDAARYVDATFVCAPALAMLSKITGDTKYLNWMDSFFWDVYGALYSQEDNLFYRDQRFIYQKCEPNENRDVNARQPYIYKVTPNGKKVLWSRGNGWAFAALTRILKYTPAEYVNYNRYKELYLKMAIELKKRQQPDGFWYPNLDDPKDYGSKETSGTGFFTYGLAWGINNGVLSSEEYYPVIEKSWAALVSALSEEGKVQWGQMVSFSPHKILQEDTQEFVSGMFLLAASEMYRMGK